MGMAACITNLPGDRADNSHGEGATRDELPDGPVKNQNACKNGAFARTWKIFAFLLQFHLNSSRFIPFPTNTRTTWLSGPCQFDLLSEGLPPNFVVNILSKLGINNQTNTDFQMLHSPLPSAHVFFPPRYEQNYYFGNSSVIMIFYALNLL